ncbi:MAG: hypothetical protein JW726_15645 [Anaerolineales bacterium]|nr:hypothetical protein [Anaerolineales bacterium]
MGIYNILLASMICPHCHEAAQVEIEIRFGDTRNMGVYAIGDRYAWLPGVSVQHGGRPENGNLDGEGYTECPLCRRDFFVKVLVREDQIQEVIYDPEKPGYVQPGGLPCEPVAVITEPPKGFPPAWKPIAGSSRPGKITYNEKWQLTPQIQHLLEQLSRLGVDVYSTIGGVDYTLLVPHGHPAQVYDEIENLMNALGKAVGRKVQYVDWYPHGYKFRIEAGKK